MHSWGSYFVHVPKYFRHSSFVPYTFLEKACIIELNANVETGNLKLGNTSTSLYFFQFSISLPEYRMKKA